MLKMDWKNVLERETIVCSCIYMYTYKAVTVIVSLVIKIACTSPSHFRPSSSVHG